MKNKLIYESLFEDNISIKYIDISYAGKLYDMINNDFASVGTPTIGLFVDNKIIGGILLDKDYLPWEYRFDIVIDKRFRGRGYLSLLMNELIEKFNNDKDADQLAATVVNKKLSDILVKKYRFNKSEFEGDDFLWIKK